MKYVLYIKHTNITVNQIILSFLENNSKLDILEKFPELTIRDVDSCLQLGIDLIKNSDFDIPDMNESQFSHLNANEVKRKEELRKILIKRYKGNQ